MLGAILSSHRQPLRFFTDHFANNYRRGFASLNLAHQLIAARLSIANGSDPTPVSGTLTHADGIKVSKTPRC